MNETIKKLREDGYPLKIKGNGGFIATLYGIQPLLGGEYEAIYRYPGTEVFSNDSFEKCKEYARKLAEDIAMGCRP